MTLMPVEFVECTLENQRVHFEVLIEGGVKFGHDDSPTRESASDYVVSLYAAT